MNLNYFWKWKHFASWLHQISSNILFKIRRPINCVSPHLNVDFVPVSPSNNKDSSSICTPSVWALIFKICTRKHTHAIKLKHLDFFIIHLLDNSLLHLYAAQLSAKQSSKNNCGTKMFIEKGRSPFLFYGWLLKIVWTVHAQSYGYDKY